MDQSPNEESDLPTDPEAESIEATEFQPVEPVGVDAVATATKGVSGVKLGLFGAAALAVGAAGAFYGPGLLNKDSQGGVDEEVEVSTTDEAGPKKGFSFAVIPAGDPVQTISVTLMVGEGGDDLAETVDLHLGAGFPLRLSPLGGDSQSSAFAAFPDKSTLTAGATSIKAGESATFEFSFAGTEGGIDVLGTTPQLLRDLTTGDLRAIGFSSLGRSEWILEGYRIEVNGKTFAEHDSVNAAAAELLTVAREDLDGKKPESEVLLKEIADLEKFLVLGLGGDTEKAQLAEKKSALNKLSGPLNDLAGIGAGYYPWYEESNEAFVSAVEVPETVQEIDVTLIAGGGEQPGTRNPLYLSVGGKKFLLSSESDPLANANAPQEFTLSESDLKNTPVTQDDLKSLGLGVVGNEVRFGKVPDRAKIQRLTVSADGKEVYDSEKVAGDRRALQAFWLLPPAHYDVAGGIIRNEEKAAEKHFWAMGMEAPKSSPITGLPVPPEAPPISVTPPIVLPVPPLAPGAPAAPGAPKIPGTPPVLITGAGPGTPPAAPGAPGKPPKAPGKPGEIGGIPPVLTGGGKPPITPPPPPLVPGKSNLPKAPGNPRPGVTPIPPSIPGVAVLPPVRTGTGGGRGTTFSPPGVTTASTGTPVGSFVPTGRIDPRTGLMLGTWQRSNPGGHVPIRRKFPLGGLSPTVFNPPALTGGLGATPGRVLTATDIIKLIAAIKNIISPIPPKPTPKTPVPPPTMGTVSFPNTSSAVEMGRRTMVDWTVLGGGATASGISRFKIDLMPVVPHMNPPVPAGSKPLATTMAGASSRSIFVPRITLPATGTFAGIKKEDLPLLYVRPRVTALDAKGKTVGTAKDGPVLPLLPDPLTYRKHRGRFSLIRGITKKPIDDPTAAIGGSFLILDSSGVSGPWQALGLAKPGAGQVNVASITGLAQEGALSGIRFAPTEIKSPFKALHTAVRTRGSNSAVLQYEGGITYPKLGGKTVPAGKAGVLRGYRVVGHLGFLAGAVKGTTKADVQIRVDLSGDGVNFGPTMVQKKNGDHVVDKLLRKSGYFRISTSKPIEVGKVPGGAMQEFDIPISFEALDRGLGTVYPVGRPVDNFTSVPFGSNFAKPLDTLKAPMTKDDFDAYEFAKTKLGNYGVTVTFIVDTSNVSSSDTLGIFGLRIVPDVY